MTKLDELYDQGGVSPWLDNLKRAWLVDGTLGRFVESGIRGVTSNPTIFAKAIEGDTSYDEQLGALMATQSVQDTYWDLVVDDVSDALSILRPVFDASGGKDGFVSIEVAPSLAHTTSGTIEAGQNLHKRIDRPNVLVKVPATKAGIPAINQLIADGHSINVTLIFGLERYAEVIEAYISGLEMLLQSGTDDLSSVHSVASFFVSRVDTEVDRRLEKLGLPIDHTDPNTLYGKAAVAQAQEAYQQFKKAFTSPRFESLVSNGANVQRPLWASTSTKNPAYDDLVYVDSLIGPNSVNTMPEKTIAAYLDHGKSARTIDVDPESGREVLSKLKDRGVEMEDVALTLEKEGVASFGQSFDELMEVMEKKGAAR